MGWGDGGLPDARRRRMVLDMKIKWKIAHLCEDLGSQVEPDLGDFKCFIRLVLPTGSRMVCYTLIT